MTPWTAAHQVPPLVRFSRQDYWSGLPFPSSGEFPDPGTEPGSPVLQADSLPSLRASLVAQTVRVLPAIQETQVQCLGQEDPLEEGMAIHSSILAWEVSWTDEFGRLPPMAHKRVRHD